MNTSSAGRLLAILEQGKKIQSTVNCAQAWSQIFNLGQSPATNPELFIRLGEVMSLQKKIESDVQIITTNSKPYLTWMASLNRAFASQSLSDKWDTFIRHIDEHTFNYLSITHDLLLREKPEKLIDESELEKIKQDFVQLKNTILQDSTIAKDLKDFILTKIEDILNAIAGYKVYGTKYLQDILTSSVGELTLNQNIIIQIQPNSGIKRFLDLLGILALATTLYLDTPQMLEDLYSKATGISEQISTINSTSSENIIDAEISNEIG